jgi:hypothetical protein
MMEKCWESLSVLTLLTMTSKNPTDRNSFIWENNPTNYIIYIVHNYIIIYNKLIS